MILGATHSNIYELNLAIASGKLWYLTLVLNTIFCIADGFALKKAAIDVNKFILWAFFLVPVYLFKRARYLHQSLAYFWVWIVCFVLAIIL